jgi:carbamoyl-phosphate synthase large subunit
VLAEEGYRVILANSNPATIMTDPGLADRTYVEPLDAEVLTAIIERSGPTPCCRPSAARPRSTWPWSWSSGACSSEFGVELIGAKRRGDRTAEDRDRSRRP